MKALDLFCCAGGASDGLVRAGFDVTGVDADDQTEYPHRFMQCDALAGPFHDAYDFIWASPPCQAFTAYRRRPGHVAPALNLIPETRAVLRAAGVPYVIENVPGAPLENPITLCGSMFGLDVKRHRIFECSFPVTPPPCRHDVWTPRFPGATNRAPNSRSTVEVGVYRIPLETQRKAMGVDRNVSLKKLSQMVPPAYAEWLGLQARAHIMTQRRAALVDARAEARAEAGRTQQPARPVRGQAMTKDDAIDEAMGVLSTDGVSTDDDPFACCGGNDEDPPHHCSDCPDHPWSGEPNGKAEDK